VSGQVGLLGRSLGRAQPFGRGPLGKYTQVGQAEWLPLSLARSGGHEQAIASGLSVSRCTPHNCSRRVASLRLPRARRRRRARPDRRQERRMPALAAVRYFPMAPRPKAELVPRLRSQQARLSLTPHWTQTGPHSARWTSRHLSEPAHRSFSHACDHVVSPDVSARCCSTLRSCARRPMKP